MVVIMVVHSSDTDDTCGQNGQHAEERVKPCVLNLFLPRTARFGLGYCFKVLVIHCFIIVYFTLKDVDCALEEFPKNEALRLNNRVEFRCKSDLGVTLKWFMQPNTTSKRQDLFNGFSLAQQASSYCQVVNGERGKYYLDLVTRDKSAQTYYCQELGSFQEFSADLIVITNETHCEREMTETHALLICTIEFRGNWAPLLKWSLLGKVIIDGVNTTVVPNEMVISTLVVPRNVTDETYICTTRFDISGKPQQTTSINVPDYTTSSSVVVEAKLINKNEDVHFETLTGGVIMLGIAFGVSGPIILAVVLVVILSCHKKRMQEENYTHSLIVQSVEIPDCHTCTAPACDRELRRSRS